MKRLFQWIGISLAALVVATAVFLFLRARRPAVPDNYEKTVKTGGATEARYLAYGPYDAVASQEIRALDHCKKYILYYPADVGETEGAYQNIMKHRKRIFGFQAMQAYPA